METSRVETRNVKIDIGSVVLDGNLNIPDGAEGFVVFVHGSGSSRYSPRNQFVASTLNEGGLATLLFDLLTVAEEQLDMRTRHIRFDTNLLAERTIEATDWLVQQPQVRALKIGYFGSSTGAAAALIAAAVRPQIMKAVVSRGGRPDLAGQALLRVGAPVLFIVGGLDTAVIGMNEAAMAQLSSKTEKRLEIIPGATHLFEEAGTLEQVAVLARSWFQRHLLSAD